MSYKREITTLGRGGSDTTAVALAAALGADCEIYSDVDGVYSGDPRVVTEPHRLESIGYEEMQELAEHGAKVLNAQAVEWAARAQIIIHARATSGSDKETRITGGDVSLQNRGVSAVTGRKSVLCISGGNGVLDILAAEGISLRHADGHKVRLTREDVPDWSRIEKSLLGAGAKIEEQGEVSLVGPQVGTQVGLVQKTLSLVGEHVGFSSAPLRLTVYVAPERVDDLQRRLHDAFCR